MTPAGTARRAERPAFWAAAFLVTLALVVSRRPDGITNPQFWAEDGKLWYAQAHQHGWPALALPAAGYLQSFSRLVVGLSLAVDLRWAPLVFNAAAAVAQTLPPLLLLSGRFAFAIPDLRVRALAALLLIGAPNGFEIQSNVTQHQDAPGAARAAAGARDAAADGSRTCVRRRADPARRLQRTDLRAARAGRAARVAARPGALAAGAARHAAAAGGGADRPPSPAADAAASTPRSARGP